jgi:site-specific recombinase XerD
MAICNLRLPDPDEYIFQPVTDNATRLPNVNAEKWAQNRNHPITSREVGRLLKVYARRAGLEAEKISVHTLRHSAAMLRREAGDDVQKISDFLGHSNAAVTRIYLHKIEGKGDQSWATVAKALGL